MDYAQQLEYNNFLTEMMMEEANIEHYIREAIVIAEGVDVAAGLTALNEGVGDKLKEMWSKFTAFIKRIFAKFGETMNKMFDTDKGWLEKYQKIITQKPLKLVDLTCRDYQLNSIAQATVEIFNYSQLQGHILDADKKPSKSKYMNHYFSQFRDTDNADDLGGWLKAYFCGGSEEEKPMGNINMTDVYNFCHDFKEKTLPKLDQDKNNIEKSAANANSLIVSAINNAKSAETSKAAEETAKTAENDKSKETAKTGNGENSADTTEKVGESFGGYSKLFNRVFTEVDFKQAPNDAAPANQAGSNNTSAKSFANNSTGLKGDAETAQTAATAASSGGLTEEFVRDVINTYSAVAGAIAGAKLTVCQWAYKDYMKIMRGHVQSYVGNEGSAPDQVAEPGSDFGHPVGAPKDPKDGEVFTDPNGGKWIFRMFRKAWQKITGKK